MCGGSTNVNYITFNDTGTTDYFGLTYANSPSSLVNVMTAQAFRDPSAWYHLMVVYDSTSATSTITGSATDRVRLYVNGIQVTAFSATSGPSQNAAVNINSASAVLNIGRRNTATPNGYFDGYLAEVNFIDGQALTPSSSGAYDTNGVWQPKKYTGTYGTNGFYLPFSSGFNTTQTYAGSFNGSSQFLSVASSASLSAGTGDFTVEANIYFNALPSASGYQGIFENQIATTAATSDKFWCGLYNSSGTYQLGIGQHNTANRAYAVWTPTVGTWYHVALVRQSGTTLVFVNGVQQTVTNSTVLNGANFSQNGASFGAASNTGAPAYFNGYISNARYVVGSAVYTTGFTPPSANLTAVTNTQWLTLQNSTIIDNSTAARTITNNGSLSVSLQYPFQYTLASVGSDYSGNSNNWTLNNINYTILGTTYDSMIDSPTVSADGTAYGRGNYPTWNPLDKDSGYSISNGNLTLVASSASRAKTNMAIPAGKWYLEIKINDLNNGGTVGVIPQNKPLGRSGGSNDIGTDSNEYGIFVQSANGNKYNNSSRTAYGGALATGDVIMIALDFSGADGSKAIYFGLNGNWANGSGSWNQTWATASAAFNTISGSNYVVAAGQGGGTTQSLNINYGQQPFSYTPPTGFNALNTYNLPSASIPAGNKHFDVSLWTGTNIAASRTITGLNFAPNLIWSKARNQAYSNQLWDIVRGTGKELVSNSTAAEVTNNQYGYISAFNSDGFTASPGSVDNGFFNQSGATYAAWQWKGGGTGVTNNSGTITSTVSANTSAGFSIVTYTGSGALATVGHGLGVAPNMIIWKNRSAVQNWVTYHSSLGATGNVYLNLTNGYSADSTTQNNTAPTSSVFTVATSGAVNGSTNNLVAYCFAAVDGYSAFGKYTGNGSTDGPFIFTNFRPRYILWKSTGVGQWFIHDTSRSPYNYSDLELAAETSAAEYSASGAGAGQRMDINSNGFKVRTSNAANNQSGVTYIYAAFAEHPFKYSRAR